jgi:hypothetical protein
MVVFVILDKHGIDVYCRFIDHCFRKIQFILLIAMAYVKSMDILAFHYLDNHVSYLTFSQIRRSTVHCIDDSIHNLSGIYSCSK